MKSSTLPHSVAKNEQFPALIDCAYIYGAIACQIFGSFTFGSENEYVVYSISM